MSFFERQLPVPPSVRQLVETAANERMLEPLRCLFIVVAVAEKRRSTRGQLLHRSQWLATILKEHPDLLELHECLRPITAAETFARTTRPARTAVKDVVTKEGVTNLIIQHLSSLGLSTTVKILTEEANAHCTIIIYITYATHMYQLKNRPVWKGMKVNYCLYY